MIDRQTPKRLLGGRLLVIGALVLVQALILLVGIWYLSDHWFMFYSLLTALSIAVVVYIVNQKKNPGYKLAWVIAILIFPVFGGLLYILYGLQTATKRFQRKLGAIFERTQPLLKQPEQVWEELKKQSPQAAGQAHYLMNAARYPVYRNTQVTYLSPGEEKFEALLQALNEAERFIFLEYFIIDEGVMWSSVLSVLLHKAKAGVDVRLIYDGMGCLTTLPPNYWKELEAMGIRCMEFNPFMPILSTISNNRDHRKIAVIDGHTAFTGGINLADEYINAYERFGHWKDASVMLRGEAVWSFTVMFLQMWELGKGDGKQDGELHSHRLTAVPFPDDGFVLPYGDSPMDDETVGENVYLNLISKANKYLYINTPYFIVDNEIMTALSLAAKSGVDVRIVTPHHPDKWYVHLVTRAYYKDLLEAGIRVYEYEPGFIHSKTVVVDDEVATVGTINFDYRSLYLHFECGVWMYRSQAIAQMKKDFLDTLASCIPITLEDCRKRKWYQRGLSSIFRLFAPFL